MFKKLLSLLLLGLLLVSFSSVVAQDDMMGFECPEGEATITAAGGAVGDEFELNLEQAERYMALCPNITVEFIEMPDSTTERLGLYQQFWQAQSPDVDLYQVDVIWAGIIAPHTVDMFEHMSEELVGEYFEGMINGQTIDGRLEAIPWFTDSGGLYYRTDLLEKYELDVPTTWDELAEAAAIIQEGERAEGNSEFWGYVWQGNSYEGLTCDAHEWLVAETGETFISPEGEINVNNDAFVAALERAASWVGGISPEAVTTYQEEESRAVWQAGNAAFMRNWPYAFGLGNAEGSPIADLFDYAPLPMGAERAAACLGGWQLAVSNYTDNLEAAVSVALFLTSPEEQKLRALSPQGANPTVPALYDDPQLIEDNPLFARMGPILETAFARPSGVTAERYNDASTIFFTNVHDVLTGSTDAQTAVEDIEFDLEDLLAEMGM
ncbi:MAG: ABC transporter substrate-binding protein [Chloroflexi bacterium]|nr:ABC transporter substrate-binding protein [Chloroflexota bacterium]